MKFRLGGIPGVGRVAQALGLNSIPALGVFGEGWSPATALALYWVESVLVIGFVAARIALHRRFTRKAGHWRAPAFTAQNEAQRGTARRGTLLASYLGTVVPFTVVHGVMLGALLLMIAQSGKDESFQVSALNLRVGVVGVLVLLVLGFAIDLFGLRTRPFRWIERATERAMGRVFVVHLTILIGMFATVWSDGPGALFMVFVVLKTLFDLGGALPEKELGLEPPRWLRWMDRIKTKDGEPFSVYWRRTEEANHRLRADNELVRDAAPAAGSVSSRAPVA